MTPDTSVPASIGSATRDPSSGGETGGPGLRRAGARTALVALLALVVCGPARSHPMPFSYLDLRLGDEGVAGALTVHVLDLAYDLKVAPPEALLDSSYLETRRAEVEAILRERLQLEADGTPLRIALEGLEVIADRQNIRLRFGSDLNGTPGVLSVRCLIFPHDPVHQTFLNVYESDELAHQEILDRNHASLDYYTGTTRGVGAVVKTFLPSGIHHILIGPDHILFLVGLLLSGGRLWQIFKIVTAFTVAHSVTLGLAALEILMPPARLIEPAIALSIVYVGADNLLVGREGRDVRVWVAFFFGFIHGFGFAHVLREFGLPSRALGWSLFSFNLGVELGQLAVVALVVWLLAAVRRRDTLLAQRVTTVGSVCVAAAGLYWFVERVFL